MHGARVLAGDLGAGDQLYARRVRPLAGGQDTVLAVVVGEGEGRKAGLDGQVDQRLRDVSLPSETVEWVCRSIISPPR